MLNSNEKKPQYLILDVDGVMTTGQFLYSIEGKTYKVFGAHDNDGIKMIQDFLEIRFVTADKRGYAITKKRIVDDMHQKLELVIEKDRFKYLDDKYGLENIAYMGDGIHDVPIVSKAMIGIVPNNGRIEAKNEADFITPSNSGEGAVLDACLYIIKKCFNEN